jgi:hypothetical protein
MTRSSKARRRKAPIWFRIGAFHIEQTEDGGWRIEDAFGRVLDTVDTVEQARELISNIERAKA